MQELQEFPITGRGVYHQGSNIFKQDKIAEYQAKDHGEEALDGRALEYTMLP
jgi:hypothetical protein